MNYPAAFTDFFKSPKWMTNLLMAGLCCLIPIVGWIVVIGWAVQGLWGREDERAETFPDFEFKDFGKHLERGLWPFVASLIVAIAGAIVTGIIVGILGFIGGMLFGYGRHNAGALAGLYGLFMMMLQVLLKVVVLFITAPVVIRATALQDLGKAFDLDYVKKFVVAMWKETLLVAVISLVAVMVLIPVGIIALCVGIGLSLAFLFFMHMHLNKQLYKLYLSRGGEALVLSPKLLSSEVPPPPPTPAV